MTSRSLRLRKASACFRADEEGATSIEYTLIGAALAIVLVLAMPAFTPYISGYFAGLGTALGTYQP